MRETLLLAMPTAPVLRIRLLAVLVVGVLVLCGVAIAAAFLVPPHGPEAATGFEALPPLPKAAPPPPARRLPPPAPAPVPTPAPPAAEASGFDWKSLPLQSQGVLLGETRPVGPTLIRRAMPRIRRCLPHAAIPASGPPSLDVALGLAGENGLYTIQDVEVLGSTVDKATESCVTESLVGMTLPVRDGQDWKRLRLAAKLPVPTALAGRRPSSPGEE
jgi:hypothetical protein